jgi:HD-like signal output (HDOD) protein
MLREHRRCDSALSDPAQSEPADLAALRRMLAFALDTRAFQLPPLPGVAAEVIASSIDDQVDATRLADLIQTDQGLASHVLRVVNSPSMRAATEIVALRQAIARLGMTRIREIAIAASLAGALFKPTRYKSEALQAWKHGLCTGLWAKEIARAGRKNTEMAYLCGLLHNIGTPVLLNALGQATSQSLPPCDIVSLLEEFGAQAGALLAKEWKLPEMVVTTIRCVHTFDTAGAQIDAVAIVNAAQHMSAMMLRGELSSEPVLALEAIRHLNLYPDDVAALISLRDSVSGALEASAV